ncbi:DUF4374 domain-containing protein [Aquimarina gracilis]
MIATISTFSCSSDDDANNPNPNPGTDSVSKYAVGFQTLPVGQSPAVDYMLELPSIESLTDGELTVEGQGIPQTGWRFFHQSGNTIFTAGYVEDRTCISYQLNENGNLEKVTDFVYQTTLNNYLTVDDKTLLAVELAFGVDDPSVTEIPDRNFYIINAETGLVEDIISHPVDSSIGDGTPQNPPYIPWVTGMVVRDGKLFLSYHKYFPDGNGNAIAVDKAYVAVLKYPEFELEKLIEDDRTSSIGTNGPSTGIEQAENGDIYSYSSSSVPCGILGATKPSGVLRIKSGETDFDASYFFDVENAPNGGKIYWMDYIGNGKALARIVLDETLPQWAAFREQGEQLKLVVLDLVNQTVTDVQGIPAHANRYSSPTYVEDGKAYVSARTGELLNDSGSNVAGGETYVYVVDVDATTAVKGAKVNGFALKGIFKVTN